MTNLLAAIHIRGMIMEFNCIILWWIQFNSTIIMNEIKNERNRKLIILYQRKSRWQTKETTLWFIEKKKPNYSLQMGEHTETVRISSKEKREQQLPWWYSVGARD